MRRYYKKQFQSVPVLTGEQPKNESNRPPVVSVSSCGVRTIQDGHWELIEMLGSGGFTDLVSIETEAGDPEGQLYNLEEDTEETNNLWNERPDIVRQLKQKLSEYERNDRSR